jgi:hypothetical protein
MSILVRVGYDSADVYGLNSFNGGNEMSETNVTPVNESNTGAESTPKTPEVTIDEIKISTFDGEPLSDKLTKLENTIIAVLTLFATSKTMRYVVQSVTVGMVRRIADTIEALRFTPSQNIKVGGNIYQTSEYEVPSVLQHYLDSGRMYLVPESLGLEVLIRPTTNFDPVSPVVFNQFWNRFNETQVDKKINLTPYTRKDYFLGNMDYAEDGNGSLVKIGEGSQPIEEAWLINLKSPYTKDWCVTYDSPELERVAHWFMENNPNVQS